MKQLITLFLVGCMAVEAYSQSICPGLASVIQLQSGQTEIIKTDYLPFGSEGVKIKLPQGLVLDTETPESFIVSGQIAEAMDMIQLIMPNEKVDIPCRKSRKITAHLTVELPKAAKNLGIKGSYNAWSLDTINVKPVGDLPTKIWTIASIVGNEGYVQYKLVADGAEVNPVNAEVVSNGMGGTNALLKLGNPDAKVPVAITVAAKGRSIGLNIVSARTIWVYWNNMLLQKMPALASGKVEIVLPKEVLENKGRSFIRIFTCNTHKAGNDLLIPLQDGHVITNTQELNRNDHHTQIMYFMMVDRFANGDPANDPKPMDSVLPKAQYYGGDLAGIHQKIKEGFFDQIGANTIWLSPISQNPQGAWGLWNKQVTTKFSAYHGYWPTSYSLVDSRFGSNLLFGEMIQSAHQRQTNIILDFVAHHVHTDHPLYRLHPDWVTPLYLPDGSLNTERWDDHRLTTWFDVFLPTLNFENDKVRNLVADSVMFWVKNYELDGFRHDASKHVPESFWRLLTQKIKIEQQQSDKSFYQIGETYGSPELIGSYVNSGQMNGQFDFNVYDASVGAFTANASDKNKDYWAGLKRTLNESFDYYGWHHLMGNISGNQDRPRFASLADGSVRGDEDTKLAGWTRDIQNVGTKGFSRMAQIMTLNMTLPGVPVIYYGDEYAMPGGNDPDNRRMMQFDGYNSHQQELIEKVKTLTQLRKSNMALLYGEYRTIPTDEAYFAYERNYFGQRVIVVFSKTAGKVSIPVYKGLTYKSVTGQPIQQNHQGISIELKDDDVAILITNP